MTDRISWPLVVTFGVLLLTLATVMQFDVGRVSPHATTRATSAPSPVSPPPMVPQRPPAIAVLSQTTERPLFSGTRRPPDEVETAKAKEIETVAPPVEVNYVLSAIVMMGDEKIAYLKTPASGELERVKEGATIEGWTIDAVHADHIMMSSGARTAPIQLRTYLPPAARPRANGRAERRLSREQRNERRREQAAERAAANRERRERNQSNNRRTSTGTINQRRTREQAIRRAQRRRDSEDDN